MSGPSVGRLSGIAALLPSVDDYRALRTSWRTDVLAGITVGIVALPLALAFGVSSGAGAEAGLITAIVAGLVAAVFGGSNVQVSGPTGAMVVVLAPIVAVHGIGAMAVVTILAGVLVLVAGVLRLGRTVDYIPWPVIEGFTLGIAVIIFLQQVPSAVGVAVAGHSTNAGVAAWESIREADGAHALSALGVVVAVAAIMLLLGRFAPKLPASFLAIVAVTVVVAVLKIPVTSIGALPDSLPAPSFPSVDLGTVRELLGPAVAVAALAAIESLLSARVAASTPETGPYNGDRELVGQGMASVASGVFGGMPATGAIARTAVNVRAGARTRLSAIVHALALLVVVYLASTVVSTIPLAALSGVLMVTAVRMVSYGVVGRLLRSGRSDATAFLVTATVTVAFDLIIAVGIGIAVAAFAALRALSRTGGVHREELPGAVEPGDERIALLRIDGALFFGAAEHVLARVAEHRGTDVVILRLSQLQIIDATGAHTLTELVTALEARGVTVLIKGIRDDHLPMLERLGMITALRHPNHLFADLDPAVAHARSHIRRLTPSIGES